MVYCTQTFDAGQLDTMMMPSLHMMIPATMHIQDRWTAAEGKQAADQQRFCGIFQYPDIAGSDA
jgi:hypothetical protein